MARGRPLYAVSVFSGAGGLDLGVERAGFLVRVQVEKDPWCVQTLRANRGAFRSRRLALLAEDVRHVSAARLLAAGGLRRGEPALLFGGPPCQTFSYGGGRQGLRDGRGLVVLEFVRLLSGVQPELFLFENVPGFADTPVTSQGRTETLLEWFVRKCAELGYAVTWGVVDAADYGAPQHRERFVVLGCRRGCPPSLPQPTHGPKGYRDHVTLRSALCGLDGKTYDAGALEFSERMREVLKYVPPGGDWRSLPEPLKVQAMGAALRAGGGKTGFWRRLSWDEPSATVVSRPDHRATCLCHPDETRPLTVREAARIQGFPDWWRFEGPVRARYRQVGDAVPVPLARALATSLARHLRAHEGPDGHTPSLALVALRHGLQRRPVGLWGWSSGAKAVWLHKPRVPTDTRTGAKTGSR